MKKSFIILSAFLIIACCLVSCHGRSIYAMERETKEDAVYNRGYEAGYEEGYYEAMRNAPERIQADIDYDLDHLIMDIAEDWKMSPGEAILILEQHADGEPVSDAEVEKAIWVIRQYYWGAYDIIAGIEDYWID